MFLFLSHVKIFSCEISLVYRLKFPYSCFFHIFLSVFVLLIFVLSVLFLVAVMSLPLDFLCNLRIDVSMLSLMVASVLLPFFNTYSMSMLSMECKALSIVIIFLVLRSIYWSSSFLQFKNDPGYLTRGTTEVIILSMWFLLCNLVWSSFLVVQRYTFLIFSFISTCLMVSTSNIPKYL